MGQTNFPGAMPPDPQEMSREKGRGKGKGRTGKGKINSWLYGTAYTMGNSGQRRISYRMEGVELRHGKCVA
jgi:hypothetical protein